MTAIENSKRHRAPVFVLGSPRSGTTLLYDMLLSAGGFAIYLAEANVFNLLVPRFGDPADPANRRKLINAWLDSKLFRATGLDRESIARKLFDECRSAGDFLRIVMDEMARGQGMQRWAENSPEGLLHLATIKKLVPDALIVHILRDGRDVAMSLGRVRYLRPFPWEERHSPLAAGVYWEWIVQQGREAGRRLGQDYLEVRFEDLITSPDATLRQIGDFICHDLSYDRIVQVGYGSVTNPNTSFSDSGNETRFNPVGRWKTGLPAHQLDRLEAMISQTLAELGYPLSNGENPPPTSLLATFERSAYRGYFETKQWFKRNPVIRSLRPELTGPEIDGIVLAEDHPPHIQEPGSVAIAGVADSGKPCRRTL
jgi:Sulfotransferase family